MCRKWRDYHTHAHKRENISARAAFVQCRTYWNAVKELATALELEKEKKKYKKKNTKKKFKAILSGMI